MFLVKNAMWHQYRALRQVNYYIVPVVSDSHKRTPLYTTIRIAPIHGSYKT